MKHIIAFPMGPITVEDAQEHTHRDVKFVTHSVLTPLNRFQQIRASEWRTGYGIPNTYAETHEDAVKLTSLVIDNVGSEKISSALAKLPTLNEPCHHGELDMDGVCKSCGLGGAPSRW